MKRYLFAYEVISTGVKSEFSIAEMNEDKARAKITERVADMEFTEEDDIKIVELLKVLELKDSYYECEGCS
ncbi:hypothetical protein CR203_05910 [Salipaludibacillus neizhouensis]|uniref:Uncharacterized protein n=1 Tax=Salipaludibacillus neizhouensis TaxID=885475 RepID=A0A3A9KCG3_9BACI|nr:hypothetical protein CR203_05910 [Salipaludibacillus neizhouensis]